MSFSVHGLLEAAGGQIVGKVRLQKVVYLLDQLGMDSGLEFEYHHFGPYSEELTDQIDDEKAFGAIEEKYGYRESDGVPYSIFAAAEKGAPDRIGALDSEVAKRALQVMKESSPTVLELAATIHWLAFIEHRKDWKDELVRRKGIKTANGRDELAFGLLKRLGLAPS